jgi:TrmH family RNA methyltransferase
VIAAARSAGAAVSTVSRHVGRTLADTITPPGIVSVATLPALGLTDISARNGFFLVLDQIRDPGNAGTLMRSALATGADAAIFVTGSVDPYGPKTVRSAAGATFRIPIVSAVGLDDAAAYLRGLGCALIGTATGAGRSVYDLDLTSPVALVLGNESWGMSSHEAMDHVVSIPMPGPVESLNVGVAGSLILFEIVRQRRVSSSRS